MIPMSQNERHTWTWYCDNPQTEPLEGDRRLFSCPFCDIKMESHRFDRDIEMANHIEEKHPENMLYPWRKEKAAEKAQKTLEGF